MAHTDKHARRLLSELVPHLPTSAERVFESRSYWDPGFFDLFREYTEELIFRQPHDGLKLAQVAVRLVHTLPEGETSRERRSQRARRVRAYSVLGSAYRTTRQTDLAEQQFRVAKRLCHSASIPRAVRADLYWRLAVLRAYQKRFDEALQLATTSVALCQSAGDLEAEGVAMVATGTIYALDRRYSKASALLSRALGTYKLPPRAEYSATQNLAGAISLADHPDLDAALSYLHRARQMLGPRRSVQKSKLYWIEGLIFLRRGSAFVERGEQRLQKALAGFVKFQVPYESALVSLDLSTLLRFQKRWRELEVLAAETFQQFRELQEDGDALAALKLWADAVHTRSLSEDLISDVKTPLQVRMRRAGHLQRRRRA